MACEKELKEMNPFCKMTASGVPWSQMLQRVKSGAFSTVIVTDLLPFSKRELYEVWA